MGDGRPQRRQFGPYVVEISRPGKVLFPATGITKRQLCDYYHEVAEFMLPHVRSRPATLHRFPDGIREEGFYQKSLPDHYPDWIHSAEVPRKETGDTIRQVLIDNQATLVYCADQAMVTAHVELARAGTLESPDRLVFDLDPPDESGFPTVRQAALDLNELLDRLGLLSYPMITGSRGIHVVVPVRDENDYQGLAGFAGDVAGLLARRCPDGYTTEFRKKARHGRLFLDTRRNYYGQTSVAPYAVRALPDGPVATPLRWDEVRKPDLNPQRYTIKTILRRLARMEDPWAGIGRHARGLASARNKLSELTAAESGA